ncbi:unnamed protein product [Notodromas monacha]|uniref:Immunoglobulin-like beta-sandwich domain-containing protein n=1 Tax=Notodromas monacha TaxID=399045 RepID=A0A7R9BX45_9CRUS|nr:unnamed protein product [Notodromas monacha]CAG0922272.1 unnamed protein product [Notodromas monacha]
MDRIEQETYWELGVEVAWIHLERNMVLTVDDTMAARIPKYNLTFEHDRTQWNLHIINVQEEDGGGYMCQLNTSPQMDQVCYIQVVVPPVTNATIAQTSIPLNHNAVLQCVHEGNPSGKHFWTFNHTFIFDGTRIPGNEMGFEQRGRGNNDGSGQPSARNTKRGKQGKEKLT